MATSGHCAYCFEVLAADLKGREALNYRQVQDLWAQHQLRSKPETATANEQDPTGPGLPEDADSEDDDSLEDCTEENDIDAQAEEVPKPQTAKLRFPSISRLQAPSPASASSSSSTPSSLSTTSSSTALGGNSKSSSNSSFFSFGRSKQASPAPPPKEEEEHPLFVTWNTISTRGHKSLRGCIGTFDAHELSEGLKSYALTAAFDDTRFAPISLSELPTLSTSVTLLTSFTACLSPLEWDLGTHGIRISFSHNGKRYGATYLPDVAVEQGWNKEETIVSLMRKAGWSGRRGEWRDVKGLNVVRYQGKRCSLDWAEWKTWRKWANGIESHQ